MSVCIVLLHSLYGCLRIPEGPFSLNKELLVRLGHIRDSLLVRLSARLEIETLWVLIPTGAAGEFSSPAVNFVCWLLFGVRSIHMLPQWHVKDPGHYAKSAGSRLHLNTHVPLTQRSRSGLTMPLCRHSVGTYWAMSSQATCQGTFSNSHLSLLFHFGLILA